MFRDVNGQGHLAFIKDYAGRQIAVTDLPIFVFQRVPAMKNQNLNLTVIVFAAAMFILTLLFWPLNAMLRTHYGHRAELTPQYRSLRMWVRLVCILNLVCLGGFATWLMSVEDDIALLSHHFDMKLHLLQVIGVLGAIGALISIFYCLRSWEDDGLWFWTKAWNTLLMLACLGFAFFVLNWHLLNFHLNY